MSVNFTLNDYTLFILLHPAGPGISSYASAPAKAGESLRACMREAEQQVPRKRHQETPLYLGATAGMRLLKYDFCVHTSPSLKKKEKKEEPFHYTICDSLTFNKCDTFKFMTCNSCLDLICGFMSLQGI